MFGIGIREGRPDGALIVIVTRLPSAATSIPVLSHRLEQVAALRLKSVVAH
ncbi:MAG: hypothetical protein ACRCUY_06505 [Thermoguttaceae bacterium]